VDGQAHGHAWSGPYSRVGAGQEAVGGAPVDVTSPTRSAPIAAIRFHPRRTAHGGIGDRTSFRAQPRTLAESRRSAGARPRERGT